MGPKVTELSHSVLEFINHRNVNHSSVIRLMLAQTRGSLTD